MPNGTIVRLLSGFGFISDEGGVEHFFHMSAVKDVVFETLTEVPLCAPQSFRNRTNGKAARE